MDNQEHSKTEEATPFKLDDARKKGLVARGLDVGVLFAVLTVIGYFGVYGPSLAKQIGAISAQAIVDAPQLAVSDAVMASWLTRLVHQIASPMLPFLGMVVLAGLLAGIVQVGLIFAPQALVADFTKLSPANGLKRVFSIATIIETIKATLKFAVYLAIAYIIISQTVTTALQLGSGAAGVLQLMWKESVRLLLGFATAAAVFAVADYAIVRRQFLDKMRMSTFEIKNELREREGDPRIKSRRKQLQRELMKRSQSMRNLRKADLLITNPTHYAVGLRYDAKTMSAPTVVARGAGDFAARLKRLAFIYSVPTLQAPELARGLYADARLDREIPAKWVRETARLYVRVRTQTARKAI